MRTSMPTRHAAGRPATAVTAPVVPRPRAGRTGWPERTGRRLRLPGRHDPAPHPARLAGVCGWAAGLALLGLPVAGRSSVAILTGAAPGWFEPVVVTAGMLGIAVTAAGFAAVHRRWLPWLLLAAGTGLLAVNLLLTLTL